MSHQPNPHSSWQSLRMLERFITLAVWCVCATFVWGGVRAWMAGAGVAMMIVALVLCAVVASILPTVKRAVFRQVASSDGNLDDEWRRFNRRG